jgi:hypothetical protein
LPIADLRLPNEYGNVARMLLRYEQAERIVQTYLEAMFRGRADIVRDRTIAKPYGWIFFYQSRRWTETRKLSDALLGGGPIFVNRFDLDVQHITGAGTNLDEWIKTYESGLHAADLKPLPEVPPQ